MQSTAALANTSTLSVLRNASKTSSTIRRWPGEAAAAAEEEAEEEAAGRTDRSAPNSGRQPLRISAVFTSTNSQMEPTI